jgi:hypothetical protein
MITNFSTSNPRIDEIETSVRAYFATSPNGIVGAKVGMFIRTSFPNYDYKTQFGSLSAFISQGLAKVFERDGNSGTDFKYRLLSDQTTLAFKPNPQDSDGETFDATDLWYAFASVGGSDRIGFSAEKKQINVFAEDVKIPTEKFQIVTSVSSHELDDIRLKFINATNEGSSSEPALATATLEPYYLWRKKLGQLPGQSVAKWESHRRNGVIAIFKSRLQKLGADYEAIDRLTNVLIRDQHSAFLKRRQQFNSTYTSENSVSGGSTASANTVMFRNSDIYSVLSQMSEQELDEIRIPWRAFRLAQEALAKNTRTRPL